MQWCPGLSLAFALLFAGAMGSQLQSFEPVPSELLRGRRLLVENYNRTVDAPGEGWVWLRSAASPPDSEHSPPRRYYVVHPEQPHAFSFYTLDDDSWRKPPTRAYMTGLRDRFQRELKAAGSSLLDFRSSPSDKPMPSSYRFSYRVVKKGNPHSFVYGYLGGAWVKYIFLVKTSSQVEPPLFAEFAASCQMLNRKPY